MGVLGPILICWLKPKHPINPSKEPNVQQDYFNLFITALGLMGGWILKTVWEAVRDLQQSEKVLSDKLASVEVLVAGQYIRRDEFAVTMFRIENKLDAITTKLDSKVDK